MAESRKPKAEVDPAMTKPVKELKHNSPLIGCRFDPSGRFVFAGAQDNGVQRYNGNNPATVNAGATYADLGARIVSPSADTNLGITTPPADDTSMASPLPLHPLNKVLAAMPVA